MMRTLAQLLVMLVLLAPACSDATAPPEPGTLVVRLTTPNAGDAAAIVTLTTPGGVTLGDVVSGSDAIALFHRTSGSTTRIAVFGPLTTGAIVRFAVPNVRDAGRYTVKLVEVADEGNALRPALGAPFTPDLASIGTVGASFATADGLEGFSNTPGALDQLDRHRRTSLTAPFGQAERLPIALRGPDPSNDGLWLFGSVPVSATFGLLEV